MFLLAFGVLDAFWIGELGFEYMSPWLVLISFLAAVFGSVSGIGAFNTLAIKRKFGESPTRLERFDFYTFVISNLACTGAFALSNASEVTSRPSFTFSFCVIALVCVIPSIIRALAGRFTPTKMLPR